VKTNIETIENALGKIDGLRGCMFDRTDQNNARQAGLIAQEVEAVLPEAVGRAPDGTDDPMRTLEPLSLIGLLVQAVKELKAEVEDLRSRVS
jgi:hypothetical protein